MKFKHLTLCLIVLAFTGCASVPTVQPTIDPETGKAMTGGLKMPSEGKSGLYVYRSKSILGSAIKKDIWVDGSCLGETARGVYFYKEVDGDVEHTISTESEFSPNHLKLMTAANNRYFIKQYLKPGLIVGGANLKVVAEAEAAPALEKYAEAIGGQCSKEAISLTE